VDIPAKSFFIREQASPDAIKDLLECSLEFFLFVCF